MISEESKRRIEEEDAEDAPYRRSILTESES